MEKILQQKISFKVGLLAILVILVSNFVVMTNVVFADYEWKTLGPGKFTHGDNINDAVYTVGNVGIGDTSPDNGLKLDVEGKIGATQYCDENGSNCVIAGSGLGSYLGLSDTPSSFVSKALQFANSAGTALSQSANLTYDGTNLIHSGGGISTGSLVVSGGTSFGSVSTNNVYTSGLFVDTDTLYVAWNTSKVGINTTNPTQALDVHGNIRTTGALIATGDLNFYWEIRPDGAICANGQILKKTGTGNWDCATDATGADGYMGPKIETNELNITGPYGPANQIFLTTDGSSQFKWEYIHGGSIADLTITYFDIAYNTIRGGGTNHGQIALRTITGDNMADGAIDTRHLALNAVTSTRIESGAITATHIGNDQVWDRHIVTNAVTSDSIADGTVTSTDIANSTIKYYDTDISSVQKRVTGVCSSGIYSIWSSGGTGCVSSDIRLKDVYGKYEKGLDEILQLNAIKYSFKEDNSRGFSTDEIHGGFIAQEVQLILPTAVTEGDDGYLDFHMGDITVAVVNAIQEFYAEAKEYFTKTNENVLKIQKQQKEIDKLRAELEILKNRF